MSTSREFFKYNLLEHYRCSKTFDFMSQYIVIYDQLNKNPNLKWNYSLALRFMLFLGVIDLYYVVIICTKNLDQLHSALYLDTIQLNGQDKSSNYGYIGVLYLYLYIYYSCYFDYPTCLMGQLKSIDNNQVDVLFSWPFIYKGRNPIPLVKSKIGKWLRIFTLYCIFTEGICLLACLSNHFFLYIQ